eukprot:c22051_g1_i5.p1 GENE.c22051_g1_i5~~c22051_g1_i5.p1  ORF type:complete len:2308 (+),score=699.29 c22051_g1_i5:197-6925(+)
MELIRKISEIESKTSTDYFRVVENLRNYIFQVQRELESMLQQVGQPNSLKSYRMFARRLGQLKNANWIEVMNPGSYDLLIHNIREDFIQYLSSLAEKLSHLDLNLQDHQNLPKAFEIIQQAESIRTLNQCIPELTEYIDPTVNIVLNSIKKAFDLIQLKFSLEDKNVYQIKQELSKLQNLRNKYQDFHPARIWLLKEKGYADISEIQSEIARLNKEHEEEVSLITIKQKENEANFEDLNELKSKFEQIPNRHKENETKLQKIKKLKAKFEEITNQNKGAQGYKEATAYLKSNGYQNFEQFEQEYNQLKKNDEQFLKEKNELNLRLQEQIKQLELIKKEFESKLQTQTDFDSIEGNNFLKENGFNGIVLLEQEITKKKAIVVSAENHKQQYKFDKLDCELANNSLLYVQGCEKFKHPQFNLNPSSILQLLKDYLVQYSNYIDQEMEQHFKSIENKTNDNLMYDARKILHYLQECKNQIKFPAIYRCTKADEFGKKWGEIFSAYLSTLRGQLEIDHQQGNDLSKTLQVVQALSCLDSFYEITTNGFGVLYKEYNQMIRVQNNKVYNNILGYIRSREYDRVDTELCTFESKSLSAREKTQIKADLTSSVESLMKQTKYKANLLDGKIENSSQVEEDIHNIKENLEKIEIIKNRTAIKEYIDEKTQTAVDNFESEIEKIISEPILKYLDETDTLIKGDNNFFEVERRITNISRIQRILGPHCTDEVTEKTQQINKNRDKMINEIVERNDFKDISKYALNPLKEYLENLYKVSSSNPSYILAYNHTRAKVLENFRKLIDDVKTLPFEQRDQEISKLKYTLVFLPDDMKPSFEDQIGQIRKLMKNQLTDQKQELESSLKSEDGGEESIKKIAVLAAKYKKENLKDYFHQLQEEVQQKISRLKTNASKFVESKDIKNLLSLYKQAFYYRKHLEELIPQTTQTLEFIRSSILKIVENSCETINGIESTSNNNSQAIEKSLENVLLCVDFSETFEKQPEPLLSKENVNKIVQTLEKMCKYLKTISENYSNSLESMKASDTSKSLKTLKHFQQLFEFIRNFAGFYHDEKTKKVLMDIGKIPNYEELISDFKKAIIHLQEEINVELLSEQTTMNEEKRDEFFKEIAENLKRLNDFASKFRDFDIDSLDIKEMEREAHENMKKRANDMGQKLLECVPNSADTMIPARNCDSFRKYYNHLVSLFKHIKLPEIQTYLTKAEEKIFDKINRLRNEIKDSDPKEIEKVAELFMQIKFISENLPIFQETINLAIDESLKNYKTKSGANALASLCMIFEIHDIGSRIISEHSILKGEDWRRRREKMQKQDDIDYVLNVLDGDEIDKNVLKSRYDVFLKHYHSLLKMSVISNSSDYESKFNELIAQTKTLGDRGKQKQNDVQNKNIIWNKEFKDNIPELVGNIFAIWTLKHTNNQNSSASGSDPNNKFLLMPHCAQVISIFRILGIGINSSIFSAFRSAPASNGLINNLVQIGTGEGKSLVMAVTACVFALCGIDVNCSCYSEYLSLRDLKDFTDIFEALGIKNKIQYNTFNKLCENLLNERCNTREKVKEMIMNNVKDISPTRNSSTKKIKVLLIDEVDVFLSEKYYGGMYTPSVYLKDLLIKNLLDTLWKGYNGDQTKWTTRLAKNTPAFQACITKFSNWTIIFDEAIKDMIYSLKSFTSSTYLVRSDKIMYVDGENVVDNVIRGYETVWAYHLEYGKGNITQSSLESNIGLIINCGSFSYAEMPHDFYYITGVTGTLKTLAESEKKILKTVYSIQHFTYMPSVFGRNNRNYDKSTDVVVENESEYFMRIRNDIDRMKAAGRSVLIFFESEKKLRNFYNSEKLSDIKDDIHIVTETVSSSNREVYIKRATIQGQVTLLTRTFGRGTDFMCRNSKLLAQGGIHVIQTFFSEELSEEYQIMGRSARQGDVGSYGMILLDKDLEWVLGSDWSNIILKISKAVLYDQLNERRNNQYDLKCNAKAMSIKQCKDDHEESKKFCEALLNGPIDSVKKFLEKHNKGPELQDETKRTILMMDGTGSMSGLLGAAKDTVCTMYERASVVLKEQGYPDGMFQMQFVIYRDYDCKENLLQASAWETKPNNLRDFMSTVRAMGGGDYEEAIEIGLAHAVEQSNQPEGISQVIIIGDAPAKSREAIKRDRDRYGGEEYWGKTKYSTPTYFEDEVAKLRAKSIPIFTFYLADGAQSNFQKIATTPENCQKLQINSAQGAELLTHVVTQQILLSTAGQKGVELYKKKFMKTSYTS